CRLASWPSGYPGTRWAMSRRLSGRGVSRRTSSRSVTLSSRSGCGIVINLERTRPDSERAPRNAALRLGSSPGHLGGPHLPGGAGGGGPPAAPGPQRTTDPLGTATDRCLRRSARGLGGRAHLAPGRSGRPLVPHHPGHPAADPRAGGGTDAPVWPALRRHPVAHPPRSGGPTADPPPAAPGGHRHRDRRAGRIDDHLAGAGPVVLRPRPGPGRRRPVALAAGARQGSGHPPVETGGATAYLVGQAVIPAFLSFALI